MGSRDPARYSRGSSGPPTASRTRLESIAIQWVFWDLFCDCFLRGPRPNWKFVPEILHVEFYSKQDLKQCMPKIPSKFDTLQAGGRVRRPPLPSAATEAIYEYTERYLGSRDPARYSRGSSGPPTASRTRPKSTRITCFVFAICFGTISKGNPLKTRFPATKWSVCGGLQQTGPYARNSIQI